MSNNFRQIRVPDIVASATPIPAVNGAKIYCAYGQTVLTELPDVDLYEATCTLQFELLQRSTVHVAIVWTMADILVLEMVDPGVPQGANSWYLTPNPVNAGVTTVRFPRPGRFGAHRTIVSAFTRDAGVITISAESSIPVISLEEPTIMITAIVGDDTGDDCVVYIPVE